MRRTRRSPAARDEGRRLDGVETARDSGRRAGRAGVTESPRLLREQMGQLASRRLWRQNVGTHPQSRTESAYRANRLLPAAGARLALLHDGVARALGAVRVDEAGVEVVARAERRVELVDVEPLDPAVRLREGEHAPERPGRAARAARERAAELDEAAGLGQPHLAAPGGEHAARARRRETVRVRVVVEAEDRRPRAGEAAEAADRRDGLADVLLVEHVQGDDLRARAVEDLAHRLEVRREPLLLAARRLAPDAAGPRLAAAYLRSDRDLPDGREGLVELRDLALVLGDRRQAALTAAAMRALERDEGALVRRLRRRDPGLRRGEVARRVHHVVRRDVAGRLELQRREERVREGRRLLIAHAQRVGMTGRRDGEHDQERDQGHKKTSHENGGNLFRVGWGTRTSGGSKDAPAEARARIDCRNRLAA